MAERNLIIEVLTDHKAVRDRLSRFSERPESSREEDLCELVHALVAHEVAEEVIVYPAFRRMFPSFDAVADARIAEQTEAVSLLAKMERLDVTDPKFATLFSELRVSVFEHARLEEEMVLEPLRANCSAETLAQLGQDYVDAKESAPTHAHPHERGTSKAGAALMGLVDRTRDAIQSALAPQSSRAL